MAAKKYLAGSPTLGRPKETQATVVSAGAGNDGDIVALDSTGKLDSSVMPVGVVAPTRPIVASEALAAGDLVNVFDNAGTANVRKADASAANAGRAAHGFVLASVLISATATVYFPGDENTAVTGLSIGQQWLSATVPGKCSTTIPSGAGQLVQPVGQADTATNLIFDPEPGYVLA